jgi:protein-S-isoprenylcysteine O-methyltransferase Ste14
VTLTDHFFYALAWLAFGILHSAAAGASSRKGLGRLFGRAHRLMYNLIAATQLGVVFMIGVWRGGDARSFTVPTAVLTLQYVLVGIGVLVGLAALRTYRAGPFLGWAQLRGEEDDGQPLVTDALHARVRHPLYTALLCILWGSVRDALSLDTAVWGSLYLFVGSIFEERRLIARYGEIYRLYRGTTPRFIPRLF